jgi:hypothetical protein
MSYSFIQGTGNGIAAPRPRQSFVPVLSLEIISAQILSGLDQDIFAEMLYTEGFPLFI